MHEVPRSRATEGFTLAELLIVVALIALVAGLAAPGIMRAVADQKTHDAALDIVRLLRFARSSSAGYGRAYLVRVRPDDNNSIGQIEVIRGTNNGCATSTFEDDGAAGCLEQECQEAWPDPNSDSDRGNTYDIMLDPAVGNINLCFQPNGVMLTQAQGGGAIFSESNIDPVSGQPGTGGMIFTIQRFDTGGVAQGVARRVVIPTGGGDARFLR